MLKLIYFTKLCVDVYRQLGRSYSILECLSRIYLAGQSAGAHLGACALLIQAMKQITEGPAELAWKASQMKAYLALSGGLVYIN